MKRILNGLFNQYITVYSRGFVQGESTLKAAVGKLVSVFFMP